MNHSLLKKRILPLSLSLCLFAGTLTSCGQETSNNISFDEYTNQLFLEEVTTNTINLHYTVEAPASFNIKDYEISLGDFSKETRDSSKELLMETKSELESFHSAELTTEQQLTYDILENYLDTQIKMCDYDLYYEPLSFSGGLQMELPILFAEYEFHTEQDVKDYLELIALTDEYFEQILDFEREKSAAGLFMSDELCEAVIDSCEAFLENQEKHYLISTFENRLQELGLSEKEISSYSNKNKKILTEQLFPSYETMITELTSLLGTGVNDGGLCYFDKGREYYELLVYSETGCEDTVNEIFERIEIQCMNDLLVCADLRNADETILDQCNYLEWEMSDPDAMLASLQNSILEEFPEPPDCDYEINYVDEALEEYLSPAFYIVAPVDNYKENVIYINNGYVSNDLYAFTTLAHEGYPGHLYQTVMTYEYDFPNVRSILNYSGYVEGWATYIEMMSYYYAGLDENIASMLSHNQSATLSLYALSDIGLHYYGWTNEDMYEFWAGYGITNTSVIDEITRLILSEPGNYLKYYVGYIEFLELKEHAMETYGEDFSIKAFHQAVLDIGPAPFAVIEQYLDNYYSPQT